jgi:hypothetical protein
MAEPSDHQQGCPRCAVLERRIAELEARVRELERLLSEAVRATKRQAAPFSKSAPKTNPKTPGRKPGEDYGTQAFRTLPDGPPDQIIPVNAPKRCSSCGGRVRERWLSCALSETQCYVGTTVSETNLNNSSNRKLGHHTAIGAQQG